MPAAAYTPGRFKNTEKRRRGSVICRMYETARKKAPGQRLSAGCTKQYGKKALGQRLSAGCTKQKRGTYAGK